MTVRAYVFPGQGVQRVGMGLGLFEAFPEIVECADRVLGYSIATLCLENPDRSLDQAQFAQPAVYVTNALHYLKQRQRDGRPPDYLAGHSLGEFSALFAAGAFDFETGLRVVAERATAMAAAQGGGMAVVLGLTEEALLRALADEGATGEGVTIANYNTRSQFVLSGPRKALKRLGPILKRREGLQTFGMLVANSASHSPHMQNARERFESFLSSVELLEPAVPVVSNVTARPHRRDTLKQLLGEQMTEPVRWCESVEYLRSAGVTEFVELGEGNVLTGLIEQIPARAATADPSSYGARVSVASERVTGPEPIARRQLSTRQGDIWARHRGVPDSSAYNVPVCVRCGRIDHATLEAALRHTVSRHRILAATIHDGEGAPYALDGDVQRLRVEYADISGTPPDERAARLLDVARRPFDLANGPLARLSLVSAADNENYLLLITHDIICDEESAKLVLRALLDAYEAYVHERQPLFEFKG